MSVRGHHEDDMEKWKTEPLPISKEPIVREIYERLMPKMKAILDAILYLEKKNGF